MAHPHLPRGLFLAVMDRRRQLQEQLFHAMKQPGKSTADALAELASGAYTDRSGSMAMGLLTLKFFLYPARHPLLRAELAELFEATDAISPTPSNTSVTARNDLRSAQPSSRALPRDAPYVSRTHHDADIR
jgi:hypothetical protein